VDVYLKWGRTQEARQALVKLVKMSQHHYVAPDVMAGFYARLGEQEQALAWLCMQSVQIVAATPDGATPYRSARYDGAVAVVLGNERHGLPGAWLAAADDAVAIPMEPPADSLNVGVAAGILLFEARHRRAVEQPHVAATR